MISNIHIGGRRCHGPLKPKSLCTAGSDASIVRRTQASLSARGEAAVHFSAYFTVANTFYLLILAVFGTIMQTFAKSSFGRSLLLTYPAIFSAGVFRHGGPTQAMIDTTTFTMTFIGSGYSKGEAPYRNKSLGDCRQIC
jgi:hypothetical protein